LRDQPPDWVPKIPEPSITTPEPKTPKEQQDAAGEAWDKIIRKMKEEKEKQPTTTKEKTKKQEDPFLKTPQPDPEFQRKIDELRDQTKELRQRTERQKQGKQQTEPGPWEKQRDEVWNKIMREMKEQQNRKSTSGSP
jgi:hypothetical protein